MLIFIPITIYPNIAYSLNALGGTALPMATVGSDGSDPGSITS